MSVATVSPTTCFCAKLLSRAICGSTAKQAQGSHVIVRNPENRPDIPMPTLLEAAQLAAYFSKAHHAGNVPVDYTWVRYVIKRKGSAPGYVHYSRERRCMWSQRFHRRKIGRVQKTVNDTYKFGITRSKRSMKFEPEHFIVEELPLMNLPEQANTRFCYPETQSGHVEGN